MGQENQPRRHTYGIRPRTLRINGAQAKGYYKEDIIVIVRRYVPKPEARALSDELKEAPEEGSAVPAREEGGQMVSNQTGD